MAAPPAILTCFTDLDVQSVFRAACSQPSLNFAPSHWLGTMVSNGIWYDTIGNWHLRSEGGDAVRVPIVYGGGEFPVWGVRTVDRSARAWVSDTPGHWSFSGTAWTIFWAFIVERTAQGGIPMGNIKGAKTGNPHTPGNVGPDLGWAISTNGTPGGNTGMGFGVYLATGDATQWDQNIDTASDGSSNTEGQGVIPVFLQRNAPDGVRMRGPEAKWRIQDEHVDGGASSESVDSTMCVGRARYGSGADPESPTYLPINGGTNTWLALGAFEGAAHTNLITHADAISAYLRASLL